MHKFRAALVGLLCLVAFGGCTTNTSLPNVTFTTVATMKLGVGTINDTAGVLHTQAFGAASAGGVFLDAISSFRNQLGNSAFIQPGNAELSPVAGDPPSCNFTTGAGCNVGQVNAFGAGVNANVIGYGNIIFQPCNTPPCFAAPLNGLAGGPPAFPIGAPTGYLLDVITGDLPVAGVGGTTYTITDQLNVNSTLKSFAATATLNAVPTILGAPANAPYTSAAGTGGGTFAVGAYPVGATEQVVVVLSGAPPSSVVAMAEAVSPATTATIPAGTLAAGVYACFVMAADFPWVESGQPNVSASPTLAGANGNADLSAGGTYACTQT
jgi:hypothetical protein